MIEVDKAIYSVLSVDQASQAAGTLGALGCTGVFHNVAPEGQAFPYLVFCEMAAPVANRMGAGESVTQALILVKAVDQSEDQTRAGELDRRAQTLLHKQPLVMDAPVTHVRTLRDSHIDLPEFNQGLQYQQIGTNYRVWVTE